MLRAKVAALLPASATESVTAAPSICPKCGGAGWIRVTQIDADTNWQAQLQPCDGAAHEQERYERARRMSDVSDRLLTLDFAGYDARSTGNAQALAASQTWATDAVRAEKPWLFLYGGFGTGKTHLMAAAFNALMAQGRYPLYTLVPELLQHIKDALDENPKDYGPRFRAVQHAPILILDDLGAEKRTGWTDEMLFRLIDHRYRHELPTAVASNLAPFDLEERIASRLQDRALCAVVVMAGDDYRQRERKTKAQRKGAH